jgi:hypothetical protein
LARQSKESLNPPGAGKFRAGHITNGHRVEPPTDKATSPSRASLLRPNLSYLFTDLRGFLMGVNRLGEAPPSETSPWPRASVSGALVPGWESDASSDLQLVADPQSVFVDSLAGEGRFAFAQPVLPGQVLGSYPKDVRAVATRAEAWLRDTGLADEARVGIELEFHLFKGIRFATSIHQNLVEIQSQDGWDNNVAELGTGYRVGHRSMQYHLGPTDEEGGLARAVGANERVNVAAAHLQVDLIDRHEALEGLGQATGLQNVFVGWQPFPFSARREASAPQGPNVGGTRAFRGCSGLRLRP